MAVKEALGGRRKLVRWPLLLLLALCMQALEAAGSTRRPPPAGSRRPPPSRAGPPPAGSRLPASLAPDVAYFDAGDASSLVVDPATGRISEQRDLLATATSPRPSLKWQGNCRYQGGPAGANGSVYMDGWTCFAKLSAPLCNGTCLEKGAYTVVVVVEFSRAYAGALLTALEASSKPSKRMVWRVSDLVLRTIPDGGFYVGEFAESTINAYSHMPEAHSQQVLQSYTDMTGWSVQALAVQPASGNTNGTATWMKDTTTLVTGRAPGLFAPVGSDFVVGCDYMETRPDDAGTSNAIDLPITYRCDPRYRNVRGRIAAVLVYGRALKDSQVSRILSFYRPRWAPASPPPPLLQSPPQKHVRGLPSDLLPDIAFFDAGDRASLTINSTSGRVTAQRDIMATQEYPRPSLTWSGNCQWDSAAGGSVSLDGKSCFALLDAEARLCDWKRGDGGFTVVLVAQLGQGQQANVAMMSSTTGYSDYIWNGQRMLAWRPNEVLTREVVKFVDPANDNPNNEYDEPRFPEATASTAFNFSRAPARTWTLDALAAQPGGTARYYRGGPDDSTGARALYSGAAPLIKAPSGADFALGCDFMRYDIPDEDYSNYEYRCDTKSYMAGRLAAVLVYGRQLSAADVSRLLTYYRTTRWLAAGTPPSPPPSPRPPPSPPSTGLPAALMPDLAYFDASATTAGRLVVPQPGSKVSTGGGVRALLDVLNPGQQRLDWFGDCRYDASSGGGSIVLDGSSCYAQLDTNLCSQWQLMLNNGGRNVSFTLVVVLELDDTNLPPPPKPPLAPSVNGDHEIGKLDTGGMGIMTYGMQDGSYYYFGSPSLHWTTKASYFTQDEMEDYNNVDYRRNTPAPVPRGVWSMEAITSHRTDVPGVGNNLVTRGYVYMRGTSAQAAGTVTKVTGDEYSFPPPDGTEFRIGCTWRDSDINYDCQPGSHLRGRLSAVLVYSRELEKKELQQLHAHFSKRWSPNAGEGR